MQKINFSQPLSYPRCIPFAQSARMRVATRQRNSFHLGRQAFHRTRRARIPQKPSPHSTAARTPKKHREKGKNLPLARSKIVRFRAKKGGAWLGGKNLPRFRRFLPRSFFLAKCRPYALLLAPNFDTPLSGVDILPRLTVLGHLLIEGSGISISPHGCGRPNYL